MSTTRVVEFDLIKTKNMGKDVFIGTSQLNLLAQVSQSDPLYQNGDGSAEGLQRTVHAGKAKKFNEYANDKKRNIRFCPDLTLNIRPSTGADGKEVYALEHVANLPGIGEQWKLRVFPTNFSEGGVVISRVDGGHRLFYSDGAVGPRKNIPSVSEKVQFKLYWHLPIDQERRIFVDCNANQITMDASLNQSIEAEIHTASELIHTKPLLWAVKQLNTDDRSLLKGLISMNGQKKLNGVFTYPLVSKSVNSALNQVAKIDTGDDGDDPDASTLSINQLVERCKKQPKFAKESAEKIVSRLFLIFKALNHAFGTAWNKGVNGEKACEFFSPYNFGILAIAAARIITLYLERHGKIPDYKTLSDIMKDGVFHNPEKDIGFFKTGNTFKSIGFSSTWKGYQGGSELIIEAVRHSI